MHLLVITVLITAIVVLTLLAYSSGKNRNWKSEDEEQMRTVSYDQKKALGKGKS